MPEFSARSYNTPGYVESTKSISNESSKNKTKREERDGKRGENGENERKRGTKKEGKWDR